MDSLVSWVWRLQCFNSKDLVIIAEILLKLSTSHWNAVDLWARDSLPTRERLMELANIKIQLSVLVTK